MKKIKKFLSTILALSMLFSVCALPAQAADVETIEPHAVFLSQHIDSSTCQELYDSMEDYTDWDDDIIDIATNILSGNPVGAIVVGKNMLKNWNYNNTRRIFKMGADSGRGCYILFYDNGEVSVVTA